MNVALAGSGGGSTRRSDAHEEVSALHTQLDALGATLTHVQLISCEVPLDRASSASRSKLWTLASSGALTQRAAGALGEVNAAAEACDQELAAAIDRGEVGALLLISADVAAATGVNRHALAAAVRSGQISGAALDVFEKEPIPLDSPLRSLPTVVLTPHISWYSEESYGELKNRTIQNVVAVLEGRRPRNIINPEGLR